MITSENLIDMLGLNAAKLNAEASRSSKSVILLILEDDDMALLLADKLELGGETLDSGLQNEVMAALLVMRRDDRSTVKRVNVFARLLRILSWDISKDPKGWNEPEADIVRWAAAADTPLEGIIFDRMREGWRRSKSYDDLYQLFSDLVHGKLDVKNEE